MTIYRKIWEEIKGPIPKDKNGRSFEIHHIDGNNANNDISNLKCVSIQEHYNIHYEQGDWGACLALSKRMKMSPEHISFLSSNLARRRVLEKTHNFLGENNNRNSFSNVSKEDLSKFNSEIAKKRVLDGTHPFLGENGKKNVLKQLENGTHTSMQHHICNYCGKNGKGNIMFKWHFENCKLKPK